MQWLGNRLNPRKEKHMKHAVKLMAAFAAFVFAFAAEAATQKVGNYTWTYEVTDGKATICRRNSNNQPVVAVSPNPTGDVTIPSTLGGYPVTRIGSYALEDCDGMTMVTVPNGVEEIEYSAFSYCDGLETIELPVSVSYVSSSAFAVCRDLSAVIVAGSNPYYKTDRGHLLTKDGKELVIGVGNLWHEGLIPDTVTDIRDSAFWGRTHMTSVTIPDTVKTIGQDAFYYCTGLTSVSVPDSVNEIGADAFRECENLKQIFLPGHLEGKLDRTLVFGNNTSLEILYRDTPEYSVVDGKLIRVMNPGNATRAVVPDGVTRIEQYAFSQVGANLDGLTHVTIPSSVAYIDPEAFLGCGNIIGFEVASDNPYYMAFGNLGFLLSKDYETLVRGVKGEKGIVTIPATVKTIGKAAFSGIDGLLNAEIASGVTTIGEEAFSGCSSLTVATLPSSVKTIGASAYYGCTFLQSVTMPNGVTTIGASAFRGCSSLQSVKIPDSVTTIGASAFRDCSSLKSAELPVSLRNNIASTVFSGCAENFKANYRCKITFNGNGGTSSSAVLFYGTRIGTALPATNRSGYLFRGWFTAKEGGTQVTELTTVSGNATYYAHWESQPVVLVTDAVTFVYNGPVVRNYGEPDKTSDTYLIPHGNSLGALPEPPAWSGHTFLGWYTARDGGTKVTAGTVVDGETYYYAHWKENAATTLTIGGGKSSMSRAYSCEAKAGETFSVACSGSWTATASESWITVSASNGKVTYSLAENTDAQRVGKITVKAGSLTCVCTITQDKPLLIGGKTEMARTYEKTAQADCYFSVTCSKSPWTAVSSASWVTLKADSASGTGSGKVTYNVAANSGPQRTATITVTSRSLSRICTITQKSGGAATLTIGGGKTSMTRAYSCEAKTAESFSVACNGSWTATASESWITVASGASGSGNGTVKYNLAENTGASMRSGNIKVKCGSITRTCTITQDKPLLIGGKTEMSRTYAAAKQTGCYFSVTCSKSQWTAVSSASWVTLKTASGTGTGTLTYDIAANTSTSMRTATIKVTSRGLTRTCTIKQRGVSSSSGPVARRLKTVSAKPLAGDESVPAGLYEGVLADGEGTFSLLLDESEGASPRTAYLYLATDGGTLAAECEVVSFGKTEIVVVTEDGELFRLTME